MRLAESGKGLGEIIGKNFVAFIGVMFTYLGNAIDYLVPFFCAIGACIIAWKIVNGEPFVPFLVKCMIGLAMYAGLKIGVQGGASYVRGMRNMVTFIPNYIFGGGGKLSLAGILISLFGAFRAFWKANNGENFVPEVLMALGGFLVFAINWAPNAKSVQPDVLMGQSAVFTSVVRNWILALCTVLGAAVALYGAVQISWKANNEQPFIKHLVFCISGFLVLGGAVAVIQSNNGVYRGSGTIASDGSVKHTPIKKAEVYEDNHKGK